MPPFHNDYRTTINVKIPLKSKYTTTGIEGLEVEAIGEVMLLPNGELHTEVGYVTFSTRCFIGGVRGSEDLILQDITDAMEAEFNAIFFKALMGNNNDSQIGEFQHD